MRVMRVLQILTRFLALANLSATLRSRVIHPGFHFKVVLVR